MMFFMKVMDKKAPKILQICSAGSEKKTSITQLLVSKALLQSGDLIAPYTLKISLHLVGTEDETFGLGFA